MVVIYFKPIHFDWMIDWVDYNLIQDRPISWDRCQWMIPGTFSLED